MFVIKLINMHELFKDTVLVIPAFLNHAHLAPVKTLFTLSDVTLNMRFQLRTQKKQLLLRATKKGKATLLFKSQMIK